MAQSIVFLLTDPIKLMDLTGPLQVFVDANKTNPDNPPYEITLASQDGGTISSDAIVGIETIALSEHTGPINTCLVVGGDGARHGGHGPGYIELVRNTAECAERVGSICSGAFLLAEAGVLSGKRAVTHWDSCAALARQYPDIHVEEDPIYIRDGAVWTSAGVTSGIDLALAMVSEDLGRNTAMKIAQSLVSYMVRPGGQSQFSEPLARQSQDAKGTFDELQSWIRDHLADDLRVDRLAEMVNMSSRTFARLFTAAVQLTPAKYVERARIDAAKSLLTDTDISIKSVAYRCGFTGDDHLRRAFRRELGVSPLDYRERFGQAGANA